MIRARSTSRTVAVARLTRTISTERSASGSTVGSDIPMSTDGAAPTAVLQAYRELQTPSTSDPVCPAAGPRHPDGRPAVPRHQAAADRRSPAEWPARRDAGLAPCDPAASGGGGAGRLRRHPRDLWLRDRLDRGRRT